MSLSQKKRKVKLGLGKPHKQVKVASSEEEDDEPSMTLCREKTNNETRTDKECGGGLPTSIEDDQFYGKDALEPMIQLKNTIYCKKRIYDMAMGGSHRATHIARRLLEGVFKREALLNSTFSGQAPRAQGQVKQQGQYIPLNMEAKVAIIEFSMELALAKDWVQQNRGEVERAMSQKIGELKRENSRK